MARGFAAMAMAMAKARGFTAMAMPKAPWSFLNGMQASRQRGLQTEVHKYLLPLKWLQGADVFSESQLVLFVDSAWKASRRERTSDTKEARNASVSVGRI